MAKAKVKPARVITSLEKQGENPIYTRLCTVERSVELVANDTGLLQREHDALGKTVNDNADKSDKHAARLTTLERSVAGLLMSYPHLKEEPTQRSTGVRPEMGAPYRSAEAYQRLWTDLFKEEPAPRASGHLNGNEAWLVNNIVAMAGSRLTRFARAELIARLRMLNQPE